MLFNSYQFWVFLAIVFVLYRRLSHPWQNRMLLAASYVFYGFWDWRFLSLIFLSTLVDYVAAIGVHGTTDAGRRRRYLLFSLLANLGGLGIFKYYGFFSRELAALIEAAGYSASPPVLDIVLPVGISFYTFQTLSYTIDVYRGEIAPERSFRDFALYVSFFPQLVAGPIERSARLLPQLVQPRTHRPDDFREGLQHVLIGLFKKVVIADNMAVIVNHVFSAGTANLSGAECLVALYAFAFQIYGDFSGYSSIAVGVAKWLGVDLMVNFDTPYFSTSIREFWRRWHISLSTWLRDYLYVPLGGSRRGRWLTYRNLMITMLLGGLWHGAAWTFVVWGGLQGAMMSLERLAVEHGLVRERASSRLGYCFRLALTFHLACLSWLVFRAESMTQVWAMCRAMLYNFEVTPFAIGSFGMLLFYTGPLLFYEAWLQRWPDPMEIRAPRILRPALGYAYCAVMMLLFAPLDAHEFIYFQF